MNIKKNEMLFFPAAFFTIFIFILPTAYAQNSAEIEFLLERGFEVLQLSQYEKAISYYDQVLEIDPTNVEALNNKGAALVRLEKYEEAILFFDKVLQIDPTNINAINNKESVLKELEEIGLISTDGSKYYVYVQIQKRDSSGNLMAFIESDKVVYLPSTLTDEFFNSLPIKKTLVRNDKTFELREFTKTVTDIEDFQHFISKNYVFARDKSILFSAQHHGYTFESGNTVTISWKIMSSTTS